MRIVYFDGHCNLCNGFIDFLIRRDRRRVLFYAPLQGSTARARLPAKVVSDLATMVLEDERGITTESSAVLRAVAHLGGLYSVALGFLLIPVFVRDFIYRQVASRRYRLAGRRNSCRLPTEDEKAQFLA